MIGPHALGVLASQSAAGGAGALSKWSTTDKSSAITVDATGYIQGKDAESGAWRAGRGTVGKSSGKYYWEIAYADPNSDPRYAVGVGLATATLSNYVGSDADAWGWLFDGSVRSGGNGVANYGIGNATTGSIMMFAFDIDTGELWLGNNGNWYSPGDPAAGTDPTVSGMPAGTYYLMGSQRDTGETFELRADSSNLAYTVPSGFTAGWPA